MLYLVDCDVWYDLWCVVCLVDCCVRYVECDVLYFVECSVCGMCMCGVCCMSAPGVCWREEGMIHICSQAIYMCVSKPRMTVVTIDKRDIVTIFSFKSKDSL